MNTFICVACVSQMLLCVGWRHNNIVRTALCLIVTNDNIQVDVCSIYCLIATIHVAAAVNDAVAIMVCAHQADYRVWPT